MDPSDFKHPGRIILTSASHKIPVYKSSGKDRLNSHSLQLPRQRESETLGDRSVTDSIIELADKHERERMLTRISHKVSRKGEQGVPLYLSREGREQSQKDKASAAVDKDDRSDCSDPPRGCKESGLERLKAAGGLDFILPRSSASSERISNQLRKHTTKNVYSRCKKMYRDIHKNYREFYKILKKDDKWKCELEELADSAYLVLQSLRRKKSETKPGFFICKETVIKAFETSGTFETSPPLGEYEGASDIINALFFFNRKPLEIDTAKEAVPFGKGSHTWYYFKLLLVQFITAQFYSILDDDETADLVLSLLQIIDALRMKSISRKREKFELDEFLIELQKALDSLAESKSIKSDFRWAYK